MRDVFATIARWLNEERAFAAATLIELRLAATAPIGTTIAVDSDAHIAGNIGAGCYEGEIIEAALSTAIDGETRLLDISLSDDDELMGGTSCGAVMRVAVWRPDATFIETAHRIAAGNERVTLNIPGTFVQEIPPRESLILVGATSLAEEIARIATRAEFRVVVVDPRPAFAVAERLPDVDEIVRRWPDEFLPSVLDERTSIVVLSHDPKFDIPALRCALRSTSPFIGLLGSRRSQRARRETLRAEGFDDAALARIRGPVGLDLGGQTVGETAVSIVAELIAARYGHGGASLQHSIGAIHDSASTLVAPVRKGASLG